MKKTIFMLLMAGAVVATSVSCKKVNVKDDQCLKEKRYDSISRIETFNKEVFLNIGELAKQKYAVDFIIDIGHGAYRILFTNGLEMLVTPISNDKGSEFLIAGSVMGERLMRIKIDVTNDVVLPEHITFADVTPDYLNIQALVLRNPGETFNQCFVREWNDFCDGFLGCMALATHPVAIGA